MSDGKSARSVLGNAHVHNELGPSVLNESKERQNPTPFHSLIVSQLPLSSSEKIRQVVCGTGQP
jgi:hypothetical protein